MFKDLKFFTVHINRGHLSNWSLGIDYYAMTDDYARARIATVFMINFVFFNITFTRWAQWTSESY